LKRFLLLFFWLGTFTAHGQTSSVLSSGKWYKLSVTADGIYRIDYNQLKNLGINPDAINPKKIQLYGGTNGMLPQANSIPRINDLKEISIYVVGADDGKFNKEDYILFFGQGPDAYQLLATKGIFQYQNNLYSDKSYYFLTIGGNDGKRMTLKENLAGNFPTVSEYDDIFYYETESTNELHSGRDWYGEQFDTKTEYTIRFEVSDIVENSPVKLISNVMGQSFSESSFQIFFNDAAIGEQKMTPIDNSQYAIKGSERTDSLSVNSSTVNAPSRTNQDIKLKFVKATTGRSLAYLDYLLLQPKRKLILNGDQILFHTLKSLEQPTTRFSISSMPSAGVVWDVTDSFEPSIQQISVTLDIATFSATSAVLRKYIAASNKNFPTPVSEGEVPNQNLHGISSLDLLIVTAPEFLSEAQRLAVYRKSANAVNAVVVTTTEVYNEFSGGKQDVSAIRDLARYLYINNKGIKNLLLFGRGSYDYKNYLSYNKNFVPIYESRNSLSPLETYSSDDYFGFLEPNEGNWGEGENPETHTLDIGVGRLPVKKIDEAKLIVDKLIQYQDQNWGEWRKEILFVADDGDFNLHQDQSNQIAESLETDHPEINTQKVFIDAFKQIISPIGQISPDATNELSNSVRRGVAIVNYTGHGGEQQWMQERILDQISLEKWKTSSRYPLLVTATCEFGRNDDPGLISTAELSMFKKDGGSIGLLTTARPVNSSTNFSLNKAFYQSLFTKNQNQFRDLGSIMRDTKNNSTSGVANRNFSLLCDPSMKLALPAPAVSVTEIKNLTSGSDTLKALSNVRVRGSVYANGVVNTSYIGVVMVTLFDKPTKEKTKGDENAPFDFTSRDNAIFRGQASIRNGQFELEFIIPSTINLTVGQSKLGFYTYSSGFPDATGVQSSIKLGAVEKKPGPDTKGPSVQVFMGDSTFINGGITGTNSKIVAILSDESGINISNFTPEKSITAILDDTLTVILNKYYQSDVDNFNRGKISYPIDGLKAGQHHLKLTASDTYGNTNSASISFSVSDQAGIQIEDLFNYPNPVTSSTIFRFKHSRSGENLEAAVGIYDPLGQLLVYNTYQINESTYIVDLPSWDATLVNGTKLAGGLYLLKLSVRSLLDGSKNEKITKVIISN
jgi:Peptidase family C25